MALAIKMGGGELTEYTGMVVFSDYTSATYTRTDTTSVTGGIIADDAGATASGGAVRIFNTMLNAKYTGAGTIGFRCSLTDHTKYLRVYIPISLIPPNVTVTTSVATDQTQTTSFTRADIEALGLYGVSCYRSTSSTLTFTITFS